jgi:hypothetical protein
MAPRLSVYPHTNDSVLAIGLYLDDYDLENGPLRILSGMHKGPVYDHHHTNGYFTGAMDPKNRHRRIRAITVKLRFDSHPSSHAVAAGAISKIDL